MRRWWQSGLGRESRPQGQLTYDCTPIRCSRTRISKSPHGRSPRPSADSLPATADPDRPRPHRCSESSSARRRLGVISPREYGVKNGRRRDSHARETADPPSRLRRCGHRTRRDPREGPRLCVCHRVNSRTRRAARGKACFGFNARPTRIAAQQPRRRATPAAAPLRAAGWNSDLNQLSRPARRAGRQPHPRRA